MQEEIRKVLINFLNKYKHSKEYKHYREQEKIIEYLFNSYPDNKNKISIFLKTCIIDNFYSTNLKMHGINDMADWILKLDIDKALKTGNPCVVEQIANFTNSKNKKIFLYSFASKYCFHHNKQKYVIYDQFISKSLIYFNKKYNFSSFCFTKNNLKNYKNLIKIINEFKIFYKLNNFSNREIDHMLWIYGKENSK
ncbi:hypothetical protein L8X52_06050 [Campylobacter lari]|nr:hypothetical protein [Campylobacter lari]MCV3386480.1 hypothetical protein [Campylobacter lari]MCV3501186.1 hypothetical protein [Campylobacter lari]